MIKDLKELQTFLKICRKQGVTKITLGGCSVELGSLPARKSEDKDEEDEIPTSELSPEQLMFFSVGGEPPA